MNLKLAITNRLRDAMGDNHQAIFTENGGTIGRADHNDWVLPDPNRFVSSVHASIEARDGCFYLIDTSMNGVFVNGGKAPLGPTKPLLLAQGMRLRFGNYHIVVSDISGSADGTSKPGASGLSSGILADRVETRGSNELSMELLIEDDIADKLDLSSILDDRIASVNASMLGNMERSGNHSGLTTARHATSEGDADPHSATLHRLPGSEIAPAEKNYRALIRGLGIDRAELEMRNSEDIAYACGSALRAAVDALKSMKADRAESKQNLSMPPSQADVDDLTLTDLNDDIVDLLLGRGQIYAEAGKNMQAELATIRQHNNALQLATRDALMAFIEQIDPAELARRFEAHGSVSGLFSGSKKASLWEQFEIFHGVISQSDDDTLPEFIKQEFSRAYLANLRTLEKSDD